MMNPATSTTPVGAQASGYCSAAESVQCHTAPKVAGAQPQEQPNSLVSIPKEDLRVPNHTKAIDLRSDTKTQPSLPMKGAMMSAILGDAQSLEDHNVLQLEQRMAKMAGKESALLLTSATQSNLIAMGIHVQPGGRYIAAGDSHTVKFEGGGVTKHFGVAPLCLPADAAGKMSIPDIEALIPPEDVHFAPIQAIALENTFEGRSLSLSYLSQIKQVSDQNGLAVHLDGSRIFNALADYQQSDQSIDLHAVAKYADSMTVCLSKGLGCPGGALLIGTQALIDRAKWHQKSLGGSMRQDAGMLATAGNYALDHHLEALHIDHQHARYFYDQIKDIPGIEVEGPFTNMVFIKIPGDGLSKLCQQMKNRSILISPYPGTKDKIRVVFHRDISRQNVEEASQAFREEISKLKDLSSF